jgi:lipopolysaccharide export system protein LptC
MAFARTDSVDQRAEIFGRLTARNRLINVLRIAVPLAGIAAFLILIGQIYLANIARQYGVSGIRIDRGDVVVETPQYSGMGSDGAHYVVTAREARTPIDRPEEITMSDATLQFTAPGEGAYFVSAIDATMNTKTQIVEIPGIANVTGEDGLEAILRIVHADMESEVTHRRWSGEH